MAKIHGEKMLNVSAKYYNIILLSIIFTDKSVKVSTIVVRIHLESEDKKGKYIKVIQQEILHKCLPVHIGQYSIQCHSIHHNIFFIV